MLLLLGTTNGYLEYLVLPCNTSEDTSHKGCIVAVFLCCYQGCHAHGKPGTINYNIN